MILVDTTPLVALCDARDRLHERTLGELDRIGRRPLSVPEVVLAEALFLLREPHERAILRGLVAKVPLTVWFPPSPKVLVDDTLRWLDRYGEHRPDWADAVLVVASATPRTKVWTHDSEFRTTWRRLDGSRVPLAIR
jgi:predicted nucleic acid-binding protein